MGADADERVTLLLDAAERVLIAEGLGAVSLRRMAREAGLTTNAAYRHVPNLEALLDRLRDRERTRLVAEVIARLPRPSTLAEWMQALAALVFDETERRGPLLLLLFDRDRMLKSKDSRARASVSIAGLEMRLEEDGVNPKRARAQAHLVFGALVSGVEAVALGGCQRETVEAEFVRLMAGLS